MILVFYDTETTGFSREHNDIIEISAIAWDSIKDKIIDEYSCYIKPTTRIPPVITELTGITNAKVMNCDGYWDVIPEFYSWLENINPDYMVGYNNAVFDYPFILAQNKRYRLDEKYHFKDYKQIDTMKIVKDLKKKGIINMSTFCFERNEKDNAKQETVAAFFNYNYEAHDSANDVKALMFIYKKVRQLDPTLI